MHKLILSVLAPFAVVALVLSISHAKPPKKPTQSYIRLGIGDHEEPNVNAELPVLSHNADTYYEEPTKEQKAAGMLGRIRLYEEIIYEDGSMTVKDGPPRPELEPQQAPAPANIQPPPCTLVVQNATIQANAATGTCHADASVLCQMNGGLQSCAKVGFSLGIYQKQPNGLWTRINYQAGETPNILLCNNIVRPFVDAGVGGPGTFRFKWDGWNTANMSSLWSLSVEIDYGG